MKLNLTDQPLAAHLDGHWIYIVEASSPVSLIMADGQRLNLSQNQVIQFDKTIGRIEVTGDGAVELESGTGIFTPAVEGQALSIKSLPPIEIAEGQSVAVESLPPIEIAEGQSVAVESLPPIEIAEGQSVAVESLPPIAVAEGQSVAVESLPPIEIAEGQSVAVESLPPIAVAEGQSVAVESLPPIEIAEGQSVNVSVSSTLKGQKSNLPVTIEANEQRRAVVLKASKDNATPVLLMGYEIDAGEKITLETTAKLTLEGEVGNTIQILEY